MFGEGNASLLNGGLAVSVIGYGLLSAFITGPVILAREAEKLGWEQQCKRIVIAELQQSQPQEQFIPQIDYRDIAQGFLEGWFGRDADPLLRLIEPFGKVVDQANVQKQRVKRLNEERLRQKAKAAGSRCNCAVTLLSERRIALGLYAGTGRLVTPPLFKNLSSELQTTLRSRRCSDAPNASGN